GALELVGDLLVLVPGGAEVALADDAAGSAGQPREVADDDRGVEVEQTPSRGEEIVDVRRGRRPQVPEEVQGRVEEQIENEGHDQEHEHGRDESLEDEADHGDSNSIFRQTPLWGPRSDPHNGGRGGMAM